jgi:hypothetical protein
MAKKASDSLKKKISKIQKQIEKLKNQISEDCQELFKLSYQEIFDNNPDFNSFSWTQYTPYFNDGDPCDFSAHTDYIRIDDDEEETSLYELENDLKELKRKDKVIKNLQKEIEGLIEQGKKEDDWEIKHKKNRIDTLNSLNIEDVEKKYKFLNEINDLMQNMDQDVLETMFGDHAKVIVTREGAEVESYEHD